MCIFLAVNVIITIILFCSLPIFLLENFRMNIMLLSNHPIAITMLSR